MTAIEQRDRTGFVRMALLYLGVFATATVAAVVSRFTEERLGLLWRHWLTRRLVGQYLAGRLYYHIEAAGDLPNPDQRIADDVRAFTTSTLSIALIFLNGTFTILVFSGVLWSISRPLSAVAALYAATGSLLAIRLGRPLVGLSYDQADREAGLRTALVNVRVIPQSAMAFAPVVGAFSVIVNQFPMLSSYAAIRARLGAMIDATEAAAAREGAGMAIVADDGRLAFERVTLRTRKGGRPLGRELSVEVPAGARLPVRGPHDATAALVRTIAGLWDAGEGRVVRPAGDGVVVLPERPYEPPATLRELLVGPDGASRVPDERLEDALRAVAAEGLVQRAGGFDVELVRGVVLGDATLGAEHFDAIVDIAPDGAWTWAAAREEPA